jgi:glycosyltransferase involved in cell wall biosynthesis
MKNKDHQILVLTYWSFPDALIQTYTLPYLRIIEKLISEDSSIFLFTLEKSKSMFPPEHLSSKIKTIPSIYHPFGVKALFSWIGKLTRLFFFIKKNRITHIHCWCTPAGAIGYILSLLTGVQLIVDSFEPHAEAMVENGTWNRNGIAYRLLWFLEKKQARRAAHLIGAVQGMKDYTRIHYGVTPASFYVKPACVDLEQFSSAHKKNKNLLRLLDLEGKIVCVYAGKFGGIYLEDEVFEFFSSAYEHWGNRLKVLLLTAHSEVEIRRMARTYSLPIELFVVRFVAHHEIASYIGLADFALTPVKPVPTKKLCSPIKDGEYWALGLPVIITAGISEDSEIIEITNTGYVWKNLNTAEYQKSIIWMDAFLSDKKNESSGKIRGLAEKYRNYEIAALVYYQIYSKI